MGTGSGALTRTQAGLLHPAHSGVVLGAKGGALHRRRDLVWGLASASVAIAPGGTRPREAPRKWTNPWLGAWLGLGSGPRAIVEQGVHLCPPQP